MRHRAIDTLAGFVPYSTSPKEANPVTVNINSFIS